MSISDEIQNEINKVGRIEDEINTNLKRRSDKIEKKLSTSIVNFFLKIHSIFISRILLFQEDKKLKFQVDNYLNTINGIKSKIGGNPEFNYRFKEQVNKFYSTYGEFKKIYDSINVILKIFKYIKQIQQSSNENSLKESPFTNQKAQEDLPKYFTRQEYEIKKEQQFKGILNNSIIFYFLQREMKF